jgi:hypothetical protein
MALFSTAQNGKKSARNGHCGSEVIQNEYSQPCKNVTETDINMSESDIYEKT